LTTRISTSRITAPAVACTIAASRPPGTPNPSRGSSRPATTAPTMPTTMLPTTPKP